MNDDLISRSELRKNVNSFFDSHYKGLVSSDLIKYAKAVDDFIDNAPTIERILCRSRDWSNECTHSSSFEQGYVQGYEDGKNERPKGKWIPIKYRPMTTEERIEFADYYGIEYCDTVDEKAFDCPMPEDGQEILISGSWGVSTDVADNDIDGGYTVYGLEGNGDWEGIYAWMPLPEPYKRGDV